MENAINEIKTSLDLINSRQDRMDKKLEKLVDITTELALQKQELQEMNASIDSHAQKTEDALRALDNRIKNNEIRIDNLERKPTKEAADRWHYVIDYIFKGLVAAAVGAVILIK